MHPALALSQRSTDPDDYQNVPRPIAAMAKKFPPGFEIAPHAHLRDQLLYAASGVMRIQTDTEAWIVPPDRAVYLPAGTRHTVSNRGHLEMRTLYIARNVAAGMSRPTVIEVSHLLRALILALIEEPVLYDEAGKGGLIARLILLELGVARHLPLVLPMPADPRLQRVCRAMLVNPEADLTLEDWAASAGASARTLARLFERELNMGFTIWRQRVRFHNAVEALATGQPIALVARNSGYRSASAFSAAFRKAMGASPSTLRAAE